MRKIIPLLLLLLLALCDGARAQSTTGTTSDGFVYSSTNSTITITGYAGAGGAVTIPSTIAQLPVTAIADNAFKGCNTLSALVIPSGIASIGDSAFYQCNNLASIKFSEGLATITSSAFWECNSLTSVTIPASVTNIGNNAFSDCSHLTSITIAPGNLTYCSVDGVVFNLQRTELLQFPAAKTGSNGTYSIPATVTTIDGYAFTGCGWLTTIKIPSKVSSIGNDAFAACAGLTNITIPSGVTSIGDYTFEYCSALSSVAIPNGVTSIGNYAFNYCTALPSVVIPPSVTTIGDEAFFDCYSLSSAVFLGNAPTMGQDVFDFYSAAPTAYYMPDATGFTSVWNNCTTEKITVPSVASQNITASLAVAFNYKIPSNGAVVSYGATGVPAGLSLNSVSGMISGTPTKLGKFQVTMRATNPLGSGTGILTGTVYGPPTVSTGTVSGVAYNSAAFHGAVNPGGQATSVWFQFWTANAYNEIYSTTTESIGSGTTSQPYSAGEPWWAALAPETLYHYRIVACNTSGTVYGAEQTFWTTDPPPTVTTGAASGILFNGATLNATVNPSGLATTVYFQYGSTLSYGMTTASQNAGSNCCNAPFSAAVTNLGARTTYYYRVVAANSSGTTYGADQVIVTPAPPPTPVTTTSASGILSSGATLNGAVTPNGSATVAYFQYGTTNAYGISSGTLSVGPFWSSIPLNTSVGGLTPDTTYHYRLVAINSSGTTCGSDLTFLTIDPPQGAPVVTTGMTTGILYNAATLGGTVNPNGATTACYFQYGTTAAYGNTTGTQSITSATPLSAAVSGLTGATTYHCQIVAFNASGTTFGPDQTFVTADPPPTFLSATATAIELGAATAQATVNPNGLPTVLWFEYGTTGSYGLTTGTQEIGSSSEPGVFGARISGTTGIWHYHVVAVNASGTTSSPDQTFMIGAATPVAVTGTCSGVGLSATLSGTVTPNGTQTTVWFNYGPTAACAISSSTQIEGSGTTPVAVSVQINGLSGATAYHYRIVAANSSGTNYGVVRSFADPFPGAVTGGVTGITRTGAVLKGTAKPNGRGASAWFEYGTDATYASGTISLRSISTSAGTVQMTGALSRLQSGATYHYRLCAANASGTSRGLDSSFTTAGRVLASTGPATNITASSAVLTGMIDPGGQAVVYYFQCWYNDENSGYLVPFTTGTFSIASGVSSITVRVPVTNLYSNGTYTYQLIASVPGASELTDGGTQSLTTPAATQAATGEAVPSATRTLLTGSANPAGLATSIYFEYGPGTAINYTGSSSVQAAEASTAWKPFSATLSGLKPSTPYHYRLVAVNSSGTTSGMDASFTTPEIISDLTLSGSAISVTVTGTGESTAAIQATVAGNATALWFQYGPTLAYGKTTAAAALEQSGSNSTFGETLCGLCPNSTYHVRCVVQSAHGKANSQDTTFKTLPRFDMFGEGSSDLLWCDYATGQTTLASVGTSGSLGALGALAVTGSTAGPTIPLGMAFCGAAEFNPNGNGYNVCWAMTGTAPAQTCFLTFDSGPSASSITGTCPLVTGTFAAPAGSQVTAVADIDGDGNPDLVLVAPNNTVTFWLLNGFTVVAQVSGPKLPTGQQIAAASANLTGNGKTALLSWNPLTGQTKVFSLNKTALASTTAGPTIATSDLCQGWQLAGINSYTGGDSPQWLLYNPATGETQLWSVNKTTVETTLTLPAPPYGSSLIGTK